MQKIKLDANIYDKESILYVLGGYEIEFDLTFKNNFFEITFKDKLDKEDIKEIKRKFDSTQLRKDIANSNKKIREYIIATALGFPEN